MTTDSDKWTAPTGCSMSILSPFIHQRILLFYFVFVFVFFLLSRSLLPTFCFTTLLCTSAGGREKQQPQKKLSANISERSASLPLKYADKQPKEEEVNKKIVKL